MLFYYNDNSLKSGIYEIRNRYSNRSYIGQAKRFKERWHDHKRCLLNNKKANKFLQSDFNKCKEILGHDDFLEFHILEVMENSLKEERNIREEHWIQQYKKYYGKKKLYNLNLNPTKDEGTVWSNNPEETKEKIRQNSIKMWKNPEIKAKISKLISKTKSLEENKIKAKNVFKNYWKSQQKYWGTLLNLETNVKEDVYCILEFSKKHNVDYKKISKLLKCERKSHKNWILVGNQQLKGANLNRNKIFYFKNANGKIFEVKNISRFCREHFLSETDTRSFRKIISGQQKSCKGWTLSTYSEYLNQ